MRRSNQVHSLPPSVGPRRLENAAYRLVGDCTLAGELWNRGTVGGGWDDRPVILLPVDMLQAYRV